MNQIMNFTYPKEALEWATIIAKSKFCPKEFFNHPESVLVAIAYGAELGLKPLQALQNICVINGKPSIYGDAMLAVCKNSPDFEWIKEEIAVDTTAFCAVKRKGQPEVKVKFSQQDAMNAGLWNKPGPWKQYPNRMLQMRARSFALRDCFPDVLKGMIATEEAQDYPPIKEVELEKAVEIDAVKELEKQIDIKGLYLDLVNLIQAKNISSEEVQKWLKKAGVNCLNDLPYGIVQKIIEYLEKLEVTNE